MEGAHGPCEQAMLQRPVSMPHRRKNLLLVLAGVLILAGGGLVAAGWYYSDALKDEALVPDHSPEEMDLQVAAFDDGTINLETTPDSDDDGDWTRPGTFGLEWMGGYGQVGAIREIDDRHVVREFVPLQGMPVAGDMARIDSYAFPTDPKLSFGLAFEEIRFSSPVGDLAAWYIEGSRDTWAIFVHGKGADQREALRMLPSVAGAGLASLVITYRNDEEAPRSGNGFYEYGKTEWRDLEAAAAYALDHGAGNLVLVGYSMGGGIVASFLYRSALADRVSGVILDAPMLDFNETVSWGARDRFVPWPIKDIGKRIAAWRFGIDWDALDYLESAPRLFVPILLFHGDDDPKVPVSTSDRLAEARPDLVTYHRTAGAGHVRSWNADPQAYQVAVREFLGSLGAVHSSGGGQ